MPIEVVVMKAVNEENERKAALVQEQLDSAGVLGINLMSSPGSGKTTLIEALAGQPDAPRFGVIEGDVFTTRDAERIDRLGLPVVQINTEGSCHLTAHLILEALPHLPLDQLDVLLIENIGNLICPASFALGEHLRVALVSTTEGEDKPEKYPKVFTQCHAAVITKDDLAEALGCDMEYIKGQLRRLNPQAQIFTTSARTGEGVAELLTWINDKRKS